LFRPHGQPSPCLKHSLTLTLFLFFGCFRICTRSS
jgi:hypothetical protein